MAIDLKKNHLRIGQRFDVKFGNISSFHSIHNVVDRGVLLAMWEELAGKVGHRDQLIIC